jgi:hypothetical protein
MDEFTISIKLGNEAMSEPRHVAAVLRSIADELGDYAEFEPMSRRIRDGNGGTVGHCTVITRDGPGIVNGTGRVEIQNGLIIDWLERLVNDRSGNPRWQVTFTDGTVAVTHSGAAINYGIDNREYRNVPLTVEFSPAGKITRMHPERR